MRENTARGTGHQRSARPGRRPAGRRGLRGRRVRVRAWPGRLRPAERRAAAGHHPHPQRGSRRRGHLHRAHGRRLRQRPGDPQRHREGDLVPRAAPGGAPPTSAPRPTWASRSSPGSRPESRRPPADYIYNDHYQQIAKVRAAKRYETDFHEFLITPWNTALILADDPATANLTSIGGPSDQPVVNGVVQEIDIKTGQVLFQWNSADHVPYTDSHLPRPSSASQPWDWFHINAVHLDTDGNLLIDARNTWTAYKVNLHTGEIMWELGGKQSSFSLEAAPGQVLDKDGEIFSWQHDPEALGGGLYTWFDDESPDPSGGSLLGHSRAVTVRLDLATHVATLIKPDNQPKAWSPGSRATADHPGGTCSSAGPHSGTSRSSARPAPCCSTRSSRPRQHLPRLPPALAPSLSSLARASTPARALTQPRASTPTRASTPRPGPPPNPSLRPTPGAPTVPPPSHPSAPITHIHPASNVMPVDGCDNLPGRDYCGAAPIGCS